MSAAQTTYAIAVTVPRPHNECFVVMPFSDEFELLYTRIHQAAARLPLPATRTKDIPQGQTFPEDIVRHIRSARVVVAVVTPQRKPLRPGSDETYETGPNANVMYELGMAQALGKPTLLMTTGDLPANIRNQYALKYADQQVQDGSVVSEIERHLRGLTSNMDENQVIAKYYSELGITLAEARCGVFGEKECLECFKTIYDYADKINTDFHLIDWQLGVLTLLAAKATSARVVGEADVSEFERRWSSYEQAHHITVDKLDASGADDEERVRKAFDYLQDYTKAQHEKMTRCWAYLQQQPDGRRADEEPEEGGPSGTIQNCRQYHKIINEALNTYKDQHVKLEKYNGRFKALMRPGDKVEVEEGIKELAGKASKIKEGANKLLINLVSLIVQ